MTEVISKPRCIGCNKETDDDMSTTERIPCANCGETKRSLSVCVSDTIEVHEMIVQKHKTPNKKKPLSEITSGHDFHRDSGTWRIIERILDRGKNWYKETITDLRTGKLLHFQSHPLDQHIGHGSDKTNKK